MRRRYSNESDDTVSRSVNSDNSLEGSNHRRRRKDKKQHRILKLMTSLQLPQLRHREIPTLRILVVADIDLECASALAEAALVPDPDNPLQQVDLCIACGPFCRPDELNTYYQGRQLQLRSRHGPTHPGQQPHPFSHPPLITSPYKHQQFPIKPPKRSREETAALEGLMTAAISQLESIVCRVLYIPGETDPICKRNKRRLTPNSRNLHQHWMPLSPGLGCAGLLHLDWEKYDEQEEELEDDDDEDDDLEQYHHSLPPLEDNELSDNTDSEVEDSSHTSNVEEAPAETSPPPSTMASTKRSQQYSLDYCKALEKLVQLAPPMSAVTDTPWANQSHPTVYGLQKTDLFQSILVTHFQHLKDEEGDAKEDDLPSLPLEHDTFCTLPVVQEHVTLEIAAGRNSRGETIPPRIVTKGPNMKVLLPGSLKERGDYCLVDIAFVQNNNYECEWTVQKTQFLNL